MSHTIGALSDHLPLPGDGALAVETYGIGKRFGDLVALGDASVKIKAGSVHALLGENGAGKSTLVKCIMGYYLPDEGSLLVDGHEVAITTPRHAHSLGLGMVYQHFTLVPHMTVLENMVMARADVPSRHRLARRAQALRRLPRHHAVLGAGRYAGVDACRRREAEGGNPQAALSQEPLPHPRRADLGADPERGRRDPRHDPRHGACWAHHRA